MTVACCSWNVLSLQNRQVTVIQWLHRLTAFLSVHVLAACQTRDDVPKDRPISLDPLTISNANADDIRLFQISRSRDATAVRCYYQFNLENKCHSAQVENHTNAPAGNERCCNKFNIFTGSIPLSFTFSISSLLFAGVSKKLRFFTVSNIWNKKRCSLLIREANQVDSCMGIN